MNAEPTLSEMMDPMIDIIQKATLEAYLMGREAPDTKTAAQLRRQLDYETLRKLREII